ncbi:DUF3558 domain-containing protein [Nocardia terpenica]|uniref:DUF3558 domain-containing protein n=1 Tax=Nocardia terpenica TaxID=455432 RepID=UPI001895A002|nr:DUF3558 domain-containing protein [Nocardia terpenica]MBF6062727.1 DUF3558 domain-containing protein [Nocardia terpenica]MBF6105138.1 DUF3558 domain-containing protein [Nocardia terpenica]MBF6112425.1 DUF3558 domain-containing protein [Nocardia terpenica]MBF6118866.1 DUF3558 domain-containing protein [Nocardia terpenica]MBF6154335.1 DUF3558 domain-containing protein [Nocardia terpenica]
MSPTSAKPIAGGRKSSRGVDVAVLATGIAGALLVAGCGGGAGGSLRPATSAAPPVAPSPQTTGFDPCRDIPETVLRAENLEQSGPQDASVGGVTSTGCGYVDRQGDGYFVRVMKSSLTLDMIKAKYSDSYRAQSIAGRRTAYYTPHPDRAAQSCALGLEIASGTVLFDLSNPETAARTASRNACDLLDHFVRQVVGSISPNA